MKSKENLEPTNKNLAKLPDDKMDEVLGGCVLVIESFEKKSFFQQTAIYGKSVNVNEVLT